MTEPPEGKAVEVRERVPTDFEFSEGDPSTSNAKLSMNFAGDKRIIHAFLNVDHRPDILSPTRAVAFNNL